MNTNRRTHRRGASTPAYYLGRPAAFWLAALTPPGCCSSNQPVIGPVSHQAEKSHAQLAR